MPTEAQIRRRVTGHLLDNQYLYWFPYRAKFRDQQDIFGVFDIVAFKGRIIKFIQFTDYSHHAARRRKVQEFIDRTGFGGRAEVWSWNDKKKEFRFERLQ